MARDTDFYLLLGAVGIGLFLMSRATGLTGESLNPTGIVANDNVNALLEIIKKHESGGRYNATYADSQTGFHITDFSAHPAALGWPGMQLSDDTCRAAGLNPPCRSTAAGAYQFTFPTWRDLVARHGFPDFSPASQDAAAYALLDQIGAVEAVQVGDIETALRLASPRWASLPFSTSGQPKASLPAVLAEFATFGGTANV